MPANSDCGKIYVKDENGEYVELGNVVVSTEKDQEPHALPIQVDTDGDENILTVAGKLLRNVGGIITCLVIVVMLGICLFMYL